MKRLFQYFAFFLILSSAMAQKPAGLKPGMKAPAFTGKDYQGQSVSLANRLGKGPVVLLFYRGYWCPYCNKQLSQMQDSLSYITSQGASVIAVTPEADENIRKTADKTKSAFTLVHDKNGKIMEMYDTKFAVDEQTQKKYKTYGIDFGKTNAENGAVLPVPAVYIIGKDGIIKQAFFDADYTKRPSVKAIAQVLESL